MKSQPFQLLKLATVTLSLIGCFFINLKAQQDLKLQILESSRLYLEGQTNINQFACHCREDFPVAQIQYNSVPQQGTAYFNQTEMKIATEKLDCGKKAMNKDLAQALKADEHPNIKLELCSLSFPVAAHAKEPQKIKAETNLTIAGTTRTVEMMVSAQQIGTDKFNIKATKKIKMTDFGIDPPTALLGLVKVKDEITLKFDLDVKILTSAKRQFSASN